MTLSSQVKGGRLPWSGLLALSCAAFTAVLTELLPAGLLPAMAAPLGVAESRIGFLVTAYAAASFVAAVPVTAALRSLPRRPVLCGALLGFAVSNALVALSSSYPLTVAARLLAGAMGGTLWAMLAGYAARMVPAERRGRAIAVVLAGITLALALGVPAGTALAQLVGWRAAFGTLALLAVLLVGWVRLRVPGFPGEPPHARVPLVRVAVRPGVRPVLCVTLFLLVGHQVMYTYVGPFGAHAGYGRTGVLLAVFGIATVGGIWLTGVLIDRFPRRTLLVALALVAGVLPAIGLGAGAHGLLVGAVGLWGVAFGGAPTLIQTALVDASGPADADVATSLQTTVYNAGIAAGSLIGGLALDALGAGAVPWTAFPPVLLALVTVAAGRRHAFPAGRRAVAREARHAVAPGARSVAEAGAVAVTCRAGDHEVRRGR
ncbi:MFS transporter [Streptomyces sp. 5-8]|uniref:MFS transporter n=1 Tax=Streptomyces musisoli TaxID=2802280 RepID=A0ABS1P9B6_9ACTN|nr:MFS transporter [Streptomyces musisoli]MBL1108976.1 MFS transporter [Streptomyces musisoli]